MINMFTKVIDLVLRIITEKYLESKYNMNKEKAKRVAKSKVAERRKKKQAKRIIKLHNSIIIKIAILPVALLVLLLSTYILSGNSLMETIKNVATVNINNKNIESEHVLFDGTKECDCEGNGYIFIKADQLNKKNVVCDGTYKIVVEYKSKEVYGFDETDKAKTIIAYSIVPKAFDEDGNIIDKIKGTNKNGELNFDPKELIVGSIYKKGSYGSAATVDECDITSDKEESELILNSKYSEALNGGIVIYGYNWIITKVRVEQTNKTSNWKYSEQKDRSNSNISSIGHATGDYAIQLDDGSYFWYHQTSTNSANNFKCTYCGGSSIENNWSNMHWSKDGSLFGTNGCAIYSMACIVSNLTGKEITPIQFLEDCGGIKSIQKDGTLFMDTTYIDFYAGGHSMTGGGRDKVASQVQSIYGLNSTKISGSTSEKISKIDEVLGKQGYVWASWKGGYIPWYGGKETHFMIIRKSDSDGNYYCFSSCSGGKGEYSNYKWKYTGGIQGCVDTMNTPVKKEDVIEAMTDLQVYGFWNNNPPTLASDFNYDGNGSWYADIGSNCNGQGQVVDTFNGWLNLYDGPTCTGSQESFYIDIDTAAKDIHSSFESITGSLMNDYTSWCAHEFSSSQAMSKNAKNRKIEWALNEAGVAVVNNRYPVAVGPGIVHRDYYSEYGGVTNPVDYYKYGTKLIDIIIRKKGTEETYYVPLTTADAKGHAYPYGMMQTNMTFPNSTSENIRIYNWSKEIDVGSIDILGENGVISKANDTLKNTSRYDLSQALNNGVIEWCYLGTDYMDKIVGLNNNFDLVGIIVYN